jgi:hypothetical protein
MARPVYAMVVGLMSGGLVLLGGEASGQVLGPVRWQFAPFCNVVTLRDFQWPLLQPDGDR